MLLGNYSVIHKSMGKFYGGNTVSNVPSNFGKNGRLRGIYSEESIPNQWGLPVGYYSGWMLPRTAGYISGINSIKGTGTAVGSAVLGINIVGVLEGTSEATASLSLIVSLSGTIEGVSVVIGSANGAIYAQGTLSGTSTASALLGALAGISGSMNGTSTVSSGIRADGYIEGVITPFTELSPQNLSNAVWEALASQYSDSTTMGGKLNLASSGGVDYDALATAVWEHLNRTLTGDQAIQISKASKALKITEFIALQNP